MITLGATEPLQATFSSGRAVFRAFLAREDCDHERARQVMED